MTAPMPRAAGFTLLELLVALALLGLIVAVLTPSLRLGTRAWDAGYRHLDDTGRLQTVQDFLRREISEAYPIALIDAEGERALAFEGTGTSVSFVAPLPPQLSGGAFHVLRLQLVESKGRRDLVAFWDRLAPDAETLELTSRARQSVLVEKIDGLQFLYFGPDPQSQSQSRSQPMIWSEQWERRQTLPVLVRLRVRFAAGSGRVWPDMIFRPMISGPALLRS